MVDEVGLLSNRDALDMAGTILGWELAEVARVFVVHDGVEIVDCPQSMSAPKTNAKPEINRFFVDFRLPA